MRQTGLRTGELAAHAGVNVETIRFYERRGLLQDPRRRSSGYRDYPAEAVRVVRFIKRAQELGFTLREVQELLRLRDSQAASCADVRAAASATLKGIDRKVDTLRAMRAALEVIALVLAVGSVALSTQAHKRPGPLAIAILGAGAVVGGRILWHVPVLLYSGLAILLGASLWNMWLKRPRTVPLIQIGSAP